MTLTARDTVTRLLSQGDDAQAIDAALTPIVYEELRALARRLMASERAGHTLQTTALVHEAYLRLADGVTVEGRAHFLRVAARSMRRVLVDHARARGALKRGGDRGRELLGDRAASLDPELADQVVALDEAVTRLSVHDDRAARVVELRFFAGLEVEATASVLGISTATVKREWRAARAWLKGELERHGHSA